jgi:CubicO group peptidase (beta-lactamase class C family)
MTTDIQVDGSCHQEFASVRDEFVRNLTERGEIGAAVTVSIGGEPVVDLWGGLADPSTGRPWETDTRVVVFSNTKGATALCAHMAVDSGELALDAPVRRYWPEFAREGKEDTTVAMALAHSAAVPAITETISPGTMYDWEAMCDLLARQPAWWEPGTRTGYHTITYGWVVGELVRRVTGKSLGEFFRSEVAGPLGLEFDIGLPSELESLVAPLVLVGDFDSAFTRAMVEEPSSATAVCTQNIVDAGVDYNSREFRAAEIGGASGVASARGLCGMYAQLAAGGGTLLKRDTLARMSETAVATFCDLVLRVPTRFSLGFMKSMDNRRTNEENCSAVLSSAAFGHVGAGGSVGFADPVENLSFGYVMNRQGSGVLLNERGQKLIDRVYEALGYRTNKFGVWAR